MFATLTVPSTIFFAPHATIPPILRANKDSEFCAGCTSTTKNLRLADNLSAQNRAFPATFQDNHVPGFPTLPSRFLHKCSNCMSLYNSRRASTLHICQTTNDRDTFAPIRARLCLSVGVRLPSVQVDSNIYYRCSKDREKK